VTHLQNAIIKYSNDKYTGFNIWTAINRDILSFNAFIEEELIPAGINVIMTAHVVYDTDAARVFLENKGNKRLLHYSTMSTMKFPCRTLQAELPESTSVADFDINKIYNEIRQNSSKH